MSQPPQKNYLFVSNKCQHSKRLLMQLEKNSLINNFQIINVDDPRIQLPQFVNCVPTLYIPSKRYVLTDNDLFKWFEGELQKEQKINSGKIDMVNITGDASILPFQISEMGNGLSGSAYSFIEEDKNDLMNQNYSFLQDRDINKMPDFTRHDASQTSSSGDSGNAGAGIQQRRTGGGTNQAYESLMQQRQTEMQKQNSPQTPNFSSPY